MAHYRATGKRTLLGRGRASTPTHRQDFRARQAAWTCPATRRSNWPWSSSTRSPARSAISIWPSSSSTPAATPRSATLYGPYFQDHKPIRQQSEIVGHAVRAMYLYCGVADVAAYYRRPGLHRRDGPALGRRRRAEDVRHRRDRRPARGRGVRRRLRVAQRHGLLRDLRGHRHGPLEPPAQPDARRREIRRRARTGHLQRLPLGRRLDGKQFFYVNPLASDGKHHRQPFFGCACCPTNVVRVLPSLPGYVYAQDGERFSSTSTSPARATCRWATAMVAMTQETRYPWDGTVKLTVSPESPGRVRRPSAHSRVVPRREAGGQRQAGRKARHVTRATPRSTARGSRGDVVELDAADGGPADRGPSPRGGRRRPRGDPAGADRLLLRGRRQRRRGAEHRPAARSEIRRAKIAPTCSAA